VEFVVAWRRNDRDNVADLKIDRRTQPVQDARERRTLRNQFEDCRFSAQEGFLFVGALPMPRRPI
jgi:hypothetical protein